MATCPNKDLQAWKDLTSQYGEVGAMFMYTIEGDIPTLSRAEEIALEYDLVGDNFLTSPNARVKPGVEELFESNPDLADIGTQEQYSQYLDTIFPDSKVKDIVYHGTDKGFQGFIKDKKVTPKGRTKGGIWFTDFANADWVYKEEDGKVIAALINLQNPVTYNTEREFDNVYKEYYTKLPLDKGQWKDIQELLDKKQGDGLLLDIFDATTAGDVGEFTKQQVVFEPEQIHILGNKQDIEGFKNFIQGESGETTTEPEVTPPTTPTTTPSTPVQLTLDLFREENSNMPDEDIDDYYNQCKI